MSMQQQISSMMARKISDLSEPFLALLQRLDNFSTTTLAASCVPFFVCGKNVGILTPALLEQLKKFPRTFVFVQKDEEVVRVEMGSSYDTYEKRSEAMCKIVLQLAKDDAFETLRYWRDEDYEVSPGPCQPSLFKMERVATSLFGVRAYGSHLNGYVVHPDKGICLWLARRSPTKQTFPGMLDNLAAGGIGVGLGIRETMIKECYEEASIPEVLAKNMVSVGCISYTYGDSRGVNMEMQYCFDLQLPVEFVPKPMDGEVECFMLCDIEEVKRLIIRDDFKPNCAAITLQFLIRHGILTPDNLTKYAEIVQKMNNWH